MVKKVGGGGGTEGVPPVHPFKLLR